VRRARYLTPACLAVAAFAGSVHAEEFVKSYTVSGRTEVYLRADDGSVRVRPSDSAKVEFRVTYEGYTLNDNLTLESRQDGNRVELIERIHRLDSWKHDWKSFEYGKRRVTIEVRAPKDSDLRIETGDGSVHVSSMNGLVDVRTGDGAVDISDLSGRVDVRSGDGAIQADRVKGDLRLRTTDGAINGTDLDGRLQAFTGDGQVSLTGRFDELNVASGDGRVVARATKGSEVSFPWNIRTGDGSVQVIIPEGLKADLDVATSDGGIHLDAPVSVRGEISRKRVRGELNGGGPPLRIRTSDGSVRVGGS
jgi:DUF4097 and DUF4098 domain-containing protein YvlB